MTKVSQTLTMAKKISLFVIILVLLTMIVVFGKPSFVYGFQAGQPIDSLNGVKVYYNGKVSHTDGRNTSEDGYNLGLKYQCVEFVKRYYFLKLKHRMPNTYGHAKDFFNPSLADGQFNSDRALYQYKNHGKSKPETDDLLVFQGHTGNPFGHVAIVSQVKKNNIEIVQQNPGIYGKTRETILLSFENGCWKLDNDRVLGWLRKQTQRSNENK